MSGDHGVQLGCSVLRLPKRGLPFSFHVKFFADHRELTDFRSPRRVLRDNRLLGTAPRWIGAARPAPHSAAVPIPGAKQASPPRGWFSSQSLSVGSARCTCQPRHRSLKQARSSRRSEVDPIAAGG